MNEMKKTLRREKMDEKLTKLGKIEVSQKTGTEKFRDGKRDLGFDLQSFWQWSASDLVSNATRGIVAEYIVAQALSIGNEGVRDEWAAYDLKTPTRIKVEVKSAAYIQSWHQKKFSTISFLTPKTRAWDPDTNLQAPEAKRHADVYVFALLAHKDKSNIDPLDVSQWEFYVIPTVVLDERTRSQHPITLSTLQGLSDDPVRYDNLAMAVKDAAK